MAASLGTKRVYCPACGEGIEIAVRMGPARICFDHVECAVTADADPLKAHVATHTHRTGPTGE